MTGLWAFEVQMPYQKYQEPPIVVRYHCHQKLSGIDSNWFRALTSILTKYQCTYQVSVYLYLIFEFPNTNTHTSFSKSVLDYWYFQYFSVSVFLKKKIITWYMIILKIKCDFTPLLMAVTIGHFQIVHCVHCISNSISLGCFYSHL